MCRSMSPLWWRDSNQTASGKPGSVQSPPTSAPEGNPEVSGAIPDIRALMSGIGGKLPVRQTWSEQLLIAKPGERQDKLAKDRR